MNNTSVDLSGLRDIHLPIQPDFWPLAYGWWIVMVGVLFFLLLGWVLVKIWRNLPSVYAIRKLNKITATPSTDLEYLKSVSSLLKRVAIAAYGRPKIAPLSDQTWQDFLLQAAPHTLSQDQAHLLAFAIYEPSTQKKINRSDLTCNSAHWIKKVLKNKKSS